MRYLDVCAGISAPTVAWKPLGWQAAAYAEIEAAPRAILAHHYPDVPLVGDFTEIRGNEFGPIDLLVGGTPCQDFSVAGLRAGLGGDRGNLSLEFLRLADRARPRWLAWENVPGVLSIDGGRAFGAILGGMGELGYGFAYRILDAQHFGVPQRRRRVFVIGYLGDWRAAAAVLFERHSLSGHPAPRREAGEGVARPIAAGSQRGSGYRNDADTADNLISATVSSKWAKGSGGPSGDECQNLLAVPFDTTQITSPTCRSNPKRGDPCHPLTAGMHPPAIAFNSREDCCSSESVFGSIGSSSPQAQAIASSAVRRLTPRECERLQGFPDDYTLVPYRGRMMADGPRYKALGNSMAVPVVRWIGERIQMVETLQQRQAA